MRDAFALVFLIIAAPAFAQQEIPKVSDPRLVVELVAQAPDIVHPVSCDFDAKGRLLVIESHTHFAPKDYKGPKFDRIRAFDVKSGKATTFFEGTRHTMDLAVHPDGSVYIATRNEILRLRETKDGVNSERIVFLDTKGNYPHNGLSGLCFDSKGDLTFGMGENLGVFFKLIGADGVTITDEQGGHIFHCSADGKKLRRVATGFWNPFGICRDIYGRTFAVDNDPDQSPPCRMLHVVEGGDYGFRFCYGRSGKHPFQSWHGTLPGTLPMMTGVGESPCEILSYESDGLPKEYLGKLMVTSWADHRVELYKVVPHGASFKAERQPFVQGGNNFRPVGVCVAPDGSLYVTDWVKSDYTLHGKGAIWRIRWKDDQSRERKRPENAKDALFSDHWPLREASAKKLAADPLGRGLLISRWAGDGRVASAALAALINNKDAAPKSSMLEVVLKKSTDIGMQEMALRELVERGELKDGIITEKSPLGLQTLAIPSLRLQRIPLVPPKSEQPREEQSVSLSAYFRSTDPFIRHAAIQQYAQTFPRKALFSFFTPADSRDRMALLLAAPHAIPAEMIDRLLGDTDEDVRFLTVKWIADERLKRHRKEVEKLMSDSKLSVRMYVACATALARIDGKNVDERSLADVFAKRLTDDKTPPAQRATLLRQVPASHKLLTVNLLQKLGDSKDAALKREAIRALVDHPSTIRKVPLIDIVASPNYGPHLRGYAMLGMLDMPEKELADHLKPFINNAKSPLRADALRALNRERVIEKDRPPLKDIDAWMKRLEGKADPEAGERVFFHTKLAQCSRCHRIDGRGADVGPDLSPIGRVERRAILESILQPSNNVAPRYVPWSLETRGGKVKNGMLLHTYLDEYTYLDAKGDRFKLKTGDLVEQRPTTTSIMPDGLVDRMTDQEVRDLLAYLQSRK